MPGAAALAQPGVWTPTASRPAGAGHYLLAAHFVSGQSGIVVGTTGGQTAAVMFRTTDAGTTWTAITPPGIGTTTAINDVFFRPGDLTGYIAGDGNYFAVTTDGGATWTDRSIPSTVWPSPTDLRAVHFVSDSRGWVVGNVAGGNGPRMAVTGDRGITWTQVTMTGAANNFYDVDFFDDIHGLAVGTGNPTRKSTTSNAGATWEGNANMGTGLQTESVSMYGLDAIDGSAVGVAVGGKNFGPTLYPVLRRTTDYGATWSNLPTPASTLLPKPASDVVAIGPTVLFVSGQDAKVIRSTDGGATWTAETLQGVAGSADLRKFSLTSDNYLWVVGSGGTVLRTRLVPDASFAPSPVYFGNLCPGETASATLTIGNTGLGVLNVAGASITQPAGGAIQFELVLPTVSRVWPRTNEMQRMNVQVLPGAIAGSNLGELDLSTNDENETGSDRFKRVPLEVVVPENGISIDSAVSRNVGTVRLGGRRTVTLTGLFRNASPRCLAPVDTVILARGVEFVIKPPFLGRDTLSPGDRASVQLEFTPNGACERYDTLIVVQSGGRARLRVPIVGTALEATYAAEPSDTLRFGGVQIGSSGTATLKLLNRRSGACLDRTALSSLTISGPNAAEFSTAVRFTPGQSFILPDGEISIPFTATPAGPGPRIAYANISHELSAQPDVVVLLVRGVDAELTSSTDEIVFPVTEVGTRLDSTLSGALRNLGSTAVTITGASITGADSAAFLLVAPTAPRTIAGRTNEELALGFLPNRVGTFSATLELVTDIGTTIVIRLRGEGDVAAGALGRDPIVFSPTSPGRCRQEIVLQFLRNTGRVPLRIRSLALAAHPRGSASDATRFSIVAPTIPPEAVIAPGDSLEVRLQFCPDRLGEHVASLEVTTNIPGPPLVDTLIGMGADVRIVAADTILFEPTRLGAQRDTTLIPFFINSDAASLEITSVTLDGDPAEFSIDLPLTPILVDAGTTMPATLRFTPRGRGPRSATLRIESSQGAFDIVLAGRGVYPLMIVTGETAPRVRVGRSLAIAYRIENRGDDSGRIEVVTASGSPAFALASSAFPSTLDPNESVDFTLTFTPPSECEHVTVLEVSGEGTTELALVGDTTIVITGIGVAPRLNARDDSVDFGIVRVDALRDSALDGFVSNLRFDEPSLLCVDSVSINSIAISGADASSFEVIAPADPRTMLSPGDPMAMTIRFKPTRPGPHEATLSIGFDDAVDSALRVTLVGNAEELPEVSVGLSLGADHDSEPGELIRVPIILVGDVASASFDSLVVDVAYHRSLLRLERVIAGGSTVAGVGAPTVGSETMTSTITLSNTAGIAAGAAAELEFMVLLGKVLASDVLVDSARVPGRPEIVVVSDSANVSIEEFCDASGRRIAFAGSLLVKASPNPATDALTLEYNLPASGPTRLMIFDAGGAAIVTIVDGVLDAGGYAVTIETRALAAGTYFCRLTAGRFESTAVVRIEK